MSVSSVVSKTGTVIYYIFLPVIWLFKVLLTALIFVTAPILHVGHYILHGLLWPVRMLGKLETLYIYFGVAVLVGILTAALLHYLITIIVRILGIDKASQERGRTLREYRAQKAKRQAVKARQELPRFGVNTSRLSGNMKDDYSDFLSKNRGFNAKGLLSTTIIEEEDSSEAGV